MRRVLYFLLISIAFVACIDEVALPVEAKFETEIVDGDNSAPVRVKITNETEGADTYSWSFEGGNPSTSSDRNPGTIIYEQEGEYTIILEASNRDGSSDRQEINIQVKPTITIGFTATIIDNNFSPVEVEIVNTTQGATSFNWTFEGGNPASSTDENPSNVIFTTPGEHKIKLQVSNGEEQFEMEETIEVAPLLVADFDYSVAPEDDDFQVPVKLSLENKSISATNYVWTFQGANINSSTDKNPEIEFTTPGVYNIELKSSNSKVEETITKTIEVFENTNLRVLENVELGINTAHNDNIKGAYYSTENRTVYTKDEITDEIGKTIDIAFFGLNSDFTFNRFVSPDDVQSFAFDMIPNATKTKFINRLEDCNCGISFTSSDFDAMINDTSIKDLVITETPEGLKEFDNTVIPRIIIFQTASNKKGVIKIKEFVNDGLNSFIRVDIKMQKEANQ
ncbi:PKD repeat protein [Tenacibaculum sp. 190524A05c]|uniref:PKD domain-containing protein n=1 Tax=Tenacibaculum platacis TaxID=3137852 RepID=UPI0031FAD6C6